MPLQADYYNNLATVVGATGAKPEIMELYAKVPSSGLDCLICAMLARQRPLEEGRGPGQLSRVRPFELGSGALLGTLYAVRPGV